ncbi:hypothetical protein AX769_10585 [Frondihabitans sp. PAMC 28766]|nr:hypothetical protein AX769_10585 [Frondihabitans sp. PAMC 28766]
MEVSTYSVDPDALRSMAHAVGLCIDSVPLGALGDVEGCGSRKVAGAVDEMGVWRRVTWKQAEASLSDLCSGATEAANLYEATDSGVSRAAASAGVSVGAGAGGGVG